MSKKNRTRPQAAIGPTNKLVAKPPFFWSGPYEGIDVRPPGEGTELDNGSLVDWKDNGIFGLEVVRSSLLVAMLVLLAGCSNLETNRVQLPPRHHRIATSKLHEITTPDYHKPVEDEALPGAIE